MQETEEIHQPEPVPEAFVPNNESLQTSQTPTDHGITKTEQIQEDAVMAEAGVCALRFLLFDQLLVSCPVYIKTKKQQ